jgi:Tfp pilus assembly protein PilW
MSLRHRRNLAGRLGLSLVEVMISLAISATLLTAIAAAFSASSSAIEANDNVFRASQAARVTMLHLLSEIRMGTIDPASTPTAMRLLTSGTASLKESGIASIPEDRTYRFDAAPNNRLVMVTNSITTDPDYTLTSNVDPAVSRFSYDTGTDASGAPIVERVNVTIAVKVGKTTVRLAGTASPRHYITSY